jgi:lysozyme
LSEDLADLIRGWEGLRLRVYDDATGRPIIPGSKVAGHPTIGYGRALDTDGLSALEAGALLATDLAGAQREAQTVTGITLWNSLNSARQAALTAMAFQLGGLGLGHFTNMVSALGAGEWQRAHDAALTSAWARETPSRATTIAQMLLTGDWPAEAA